MTVTVTVTVTVAATAATTERVVEEPLGRAATRTVGTGGGRGPG